MKYACLLIALTVAAPSFAQVTLPGGIQLPRRGKKKAEEQPVVTHTGVLHTLSDSAVIIVTADKRTIRAKRTDATSFRGKDIAVGDTVRIECSEDDEGYLTVATIVLEKKGAGAPLPPVAEPAKASAPETSDPDEELRRGPKSTLSGQGVDADPDRPRTKRGRPAPRPGSSESEPVVTASRTTPDGQPATPAPRRPTVLEMPDDPNIGKARDAVKNWIDNLPSFSCQQQMARYVSNTRPVSWKAIDVVSADLVFEKGQEHYTGLTINGKPVKKNIEELAGTWSKGEFGTTLGDLFSPATNANFRLARTTSIANRSAWVYQFDVDQENSHWHIMGAAQSMNPGYRGSVWIDTQTFQVLRIEMQGWKLPKGFSLDTIESAIDFEYIRLSEKTFLLPVHAEMLACQRGSTECSRNVIDFRNYHKYEGKSTITF